MSLWGSFNQQHPFRNHHSEGLARERPEYVVDEQAHDNQLERPSPPGHEVKLSTHPPNRKEVTVKKTVVTAKNQRWNTERDQLIGRIIQASGYRSADVTALLGLNVRWETSPESDVEAWEKFETWSNLLGLAQIPFAFGPVTNSITFDLPRSSSRESETVVLMFPDTEKVTSTRYVTRELEARVTELEKITTALAAILVSEGRASWSDSPMTAEQGPFIVQGFDFEKLNADLQEIFKKFTR